MYYNLKKNSISYKYYNYIIKPNLILKGKFKKTRKIRSIKEIEIILYNNNTILKKNLIRLLLNTIFNKKGLYYKHNHKKLYFCKLHFKNNNVFELLDIFMLNSLFMNNLLLSIHNFNKNLTKKVFNLEKFYPLNKNVILNQFIKNITIKMILKK